MRNIINISLPPALAKVVKEAVNSGNYASTSEFFRDLLRSWMDEQLHKDVLESERDVAKGKVKKLRSLKDLR